MFCENCSCELPVDAKFCVLCGHKVKVEKQVSYVVTSVLDDTYEEILSRTEQINDFTSSEADKCKNEDCNAAELFDYQHKDYEAKQEIDSNEKEANSEKDNAICVSKKSILDMSVSEIIYRIQRKINSLFQNGVDIKVVLGIVGVIAVFFMCLSVFGSKPEKLIVGTWVEQTDDYSQGEKMIFYENGTCLFDGITADYYISDDTLTVSAYWVTVEYKIDISRNRLKLLEEGDFPGEEDIYKRVY